MSSIVHSRSEGVQELCEALGIEKNCMGFTLVCKPDNIIRLHVTYAVTDDQMKAATEVFKKYKLEEK